MFNLVQGQAEMQSIKSTGSRPAELSFVSESCKELGWANPKSWDANVSEPWSCWTSGV